jgi:hypothetical protein
MVKHGFIHLRFGFSLFGCYLKAAVQSILFFLPEKVGPIIFELGLKLYGQYIEVKTNILIED